MNTDSQRSHWASWLLYVFAIAFLFSTKMNCMRICYAIALLLFFSFQTIAQSGVLTFPIGRIRIKNALDTAKNQDHCTFLFDNTGAFGDSLINIPTTHMTLDALFLLIHRSYPIHVVAHNKGFTIVKDPVIISATVIGEDQHPLADVNIEVIKPRFFTTTDRNGSFSLINIPKGSVVQLTYVEKDTLTLVIGDNLPPLITLHNRRTTMHEAVVELNTGYQKMSPTAANVQGVYALVDNELFNRNPSPYVLDRLENTVAGLYTAHGSAMPGKSTGVTSPMLRGPSTINANGNVLLVVDNFPYEGDLHNINPDDIENVTILKDAAASSIWGARAGNGVIVVTTKKGKGVGTYVTFNSSLGFQDRPDINNIHTISSRDYIGFEKQLYDSGYYNNVLANPTGQSSISPVVSLLNDKSISDGTRNTMIDSIGKYDVRNDVRQYFYRPAFLYRNSLQLSGGNNIANYYASGGWDHSLSSLTGARYDRVTCRLQTGFTLTPRIKAEAVLQYTGNTNKQGDNLGDNYPALSYGKDIYPYARLVGPGGQPLPVYTNYGAGFIQQSLQQGLLDWSYSPVAELGAVKNTTATTDVLLNTNLYYKISAHLKLELKYQYEQQQINGSVLYTDSSYYARNLENSFTQIDQATGALYYPIPLGGIMDMSLQKLVSQQGRVQLNYHKIDQHAGEWNGLMGGEIRSLVNSGHSERYYGYAPGTISVNPAINYGTLYATNPNGDSGYIPTSPLPTLTTDHFLSAYANGSYTYDQRYTASGSIREDEANLFGVATNRKGVPLWSASLSWQANKEKFFPAHLLPLLKLRTSYGSSGNVSKVVSAYTTATIVTGSPYNAATLQTLSNDNLRWEQTSIFNIGLDFATKENIISGTFDYYLKNSRYLMAPMLIDPTYGLTVNPNTPSLIYSNSAAMKGKGIDLTLTSHNIRGPLSWTTNFIFSYSTDKVTRYLAPTGLGYTYLDPYAAHPVTGKPLNGLFSFRYGGLNQQGDPIGCYNNNKSSTNYAAIYNNTPLDSMAYNGPTRPRFFGVLRNTLSLGRFSLSFNISYEMGHYFRKDGLNYLNMATNWNGSSDYTLRWQKPGDELHTNVPAFRYPIDPYRGIFYTNSSALILKADNIRLQDINCSYDFNGKSQSHLPFKHIRFYVYCSNPGLVWTANHVHIDPHYNNISRESPSFVWGMNLSW